MMFVAGLIVALAGYGLGARLRSTRIVNGAAAAALVVSSLGTFLWQVPPYRYLFETLGYTYALAMFGMFFLSAGILLRALLVRVWSAVRAASD
ncbi:MAG: hypothetical protein QN178_00375 [Armatimonadota bacterium]|nr:hypothetical protein [Armatimonadota bacterium]